MQDEAAHPKWLQVQGKAVTEGDLKQILQAYAVVETGEEGDIEASPQRTVGAARLLGSLGLKHEHRSPSRKSIKPQMQGGGLRGMPALGEAAVAHTPSAHTPVLSCPALPRPPDLDKVAHYLMQRFGEETPAAEQERQSGDGSADAMPRHPKQQQQQPASLAAAWPPAAFPAVPCRAGDFRIAAHLGPGAARGPLSTAELFGGDASNGRRLAHAMLSESEQRGAADAGGSLVQVQGSLATAQQRLLDTQQQLMVQHASLLRAVGSGIAFGGADLALDQGLLRSGSVTQRRMMQRSDSGRAAALPPGRSAFAALALQLPLSESSEDER